MRQSSKESILELINNFDDALTEVSCELTREIVTCTDMQDAMSIQEDFHRLDVVSESLELTRKRFVEIYGVD